MKKLLPLFLAVLILTSCQQHPVSASLSSPSPDGKTMITIKAQKPSSLDPFTVTMEVKEGDVSQGSLQFEIGASTIDSSNVKYEWADSNNCIITFTHSDGEKRIFRYYATSTNVVLQEIKKD